MTERHPGRPKKQGPFEPCKAEGCTETTEGGSLGFCHKHYIYSRRGIFDPQTGEQLRELQRVATYGSGARCLVPGCDRRPKGRDLCMLHYQQWQAGVDLGVQVPEERGHEKGPSYGETATCLVTGCEERPVNRWMCSRHSQQREAGIIDAQGNQLRELLPMGRPRAERWVGQDGYVLVQAPEGHPYPRIDGSVLEHRLVKEQQLGCYLHPDEFLVHHKNGIRSDNRPENLEVLRARTGHGEGHPPGSEIETLTLVCLLLEKPDLPDGLRQWLEFYKATVLTQRPSQS